VPPSPMTRRIARAGHEDGFADRRDNRHGQTVLDERLSIYTAPSGGLSRCQQRALYGRVASAFLNGERQRRIDRVLPGSAPSSGDKIGIHAWRLASVKISQPAQPLIIATGLDRTPSNVGNRPVRRELPLTEFKEEIRCNFRSLHQYSSLAAFCAGGSPSRRAAGSTR
jgi:hypothetical protein